MGDRCAHAGGPGRSALQEFASLADDGSTAVRRASLTSRDRGAAGGARMTGKRVLGIVLAGAPGRRLAPLTAERAKGAVPFGGLYRLVDFTLSNLVNGGIRRICVLTQYKSHSLDRHLATAWG